MKHAILIFLALALFLASCMSPEDRLARANKNLGSKKNPIKMYFVPSKEAGKVVTSGEAIAEFLHKETGYYFKVAVPTNYAGVIEAMGVQRADVAWLSTFAYILAREKFNAQVRFMTVRNGLTEYRGQFVTKTDSGIDSLSQIQGKVIAYTDAASTAGYIYPSSLLEELGIKPGKYLFANGHGPAILALYSGNADVACSYWSPADAQGNPQDARKEALETWPQVFSQTKVIGFTDWITNDTVTLRDKLPPDVEANLVKALTKLSTDPEGVQLLQKLYSIDGLKPASDSDYDKVREQLRKYGKDPKNFVK